MGKPKKVKTQIRKYKKLLLLKAKKKGLYENFGDKEIIESKGFCCELCGGLIKGKCYNKNGYITHINQCSDKQNCNN
tara:strand:+ start:725 stop:955 length:231 start_codon:yes stop_codon:yes gene_type:complete